MARRAAMDSPPTPPCDSEPPETWEEEILAYEASDRIRPPLPGVTVFVGSSSIRMWTTLERDMAPLPVIDRGFGGAQMDAVVHYAPRIVIPYRPRAVVLCAGENDLEPHRGKSPERVLDDVARFVALVADAVESVRFYLLTIKPSPARHASWPAAMRFNELLGSLCDTDPRCSLVDVAGASFDERARLREGLFLADELHLSERGYELWTAVLRPRLLTDAGLDPNAKYEPVDAQDRAASTTERSG